MKERTSLKREKAAAYKWVWVYRFAKPNSANLAGLVSQIGHSYPPNWRQVGQAGGGA